MIQEKEEIKDFPYLGILMISIEHVFKANHHTKNAEKNEVRN
jgi:hypothetical protein